MQVKAQLKYLKIAPRKVRLVANLVKGLSVDEAENQLKFLAKRSAGQILKLLKSAVANAVHNFNLDKNNLYIKKIAVDGGPMSKRWLPRAMGRATPIQKKTSHITLILESSVKGIKKEKKIKLERPEKGTEAETPIVKEEVKPTVQQPPRAFKPKFEKSLAKRTIGFGKKIFRRKAI
jgi:large subunit ribosomal protein L22